MTRRGAAPSIPTLRAGSPPWPPPARREATTAKDAAKQRRHLTIAVLAAVIGVIILVVSLAGGDPVSLVTLVGLLFLAVAAARYSLARRA